MITEDVDVEIGSYVWKHKNSTILFWWSKNEVDRDSWHYTVIKERFLDMPYKFEYVSMWVDWVPG